MKVGKAPAIVMLMLACILAILAVALLAFIPAATEPEDWLGPLVGSAISFVSAVALTLDSREILHFSIFRRISNVWLHAVNVLAILLVFSLAAPGLLWDIVYRFETKVLLFVGVALICSYAIAATERHNNKRAS